MNQVKSLLISAAFMAASFAGYAQTAKNFGALSALQLNPAAAAAKIHSKTQDIHMRTEAMHYIWSTGAARWDSSYRMKYHYDNFDRAQANLRYQFYGNDSFALTSREVYEYDIYGNQVLNTTQYYIDGQWENAERDTQAYTSDGLNTFYADETWDDSSKAWIMEGGYRALLTYDGSKLMKQLSQSWDGTNWVNESLIDIYYDASDKITSALVRQGWTGSGYQDSIMLADLVFFQNNPELPQSFVAEVYAGGNWIPGQRYTATYNANGDQLSSLTEIFAVTKWVNQNKETFSYDTHNNFTGYTFEQWSSNAWVISYGTRNQLTYNGDDVSEEIFQAYNTSSKQWENGTKDVYTYGIPTAIKGYAAALQVKAYPNPLAGQLTIQASELKNKRVHVVITDMLGKAVMEQDVMATGGELRLDLETSALQKGMYALQLQAGSQVYSQKLIKN